MSEETKKSAWRIVDWLSWLALAAGLLDAGLKWVVQYDVPVSATWLAAGGGVIRVLRMICAAGVGSTSPATLLAVLTMSIGGIAGGQVEPESRTVVTTASQPASTAAAMTMDVIDREAVDAPDIVQPSVPAVAPVTEPGVQSGPPDAIDSDPPDVPPNQDAITSAGIDKRDRRGRGRDRYNRRNSNARMGDGLHATIRGCRRICMSLTLMMLMVATGGCGYWNIKPDTNTANELLQATCVSEMYYATGKLPNGTALTAEEIKARCDNFAHVRETRSLGSCDGIKP